MIPCKDCILFAICNSNRKSVSCSILYEYFIEGDDNINQYGNSGDPPQTDMPRLKEIQLFFKKTSNNISTNGRALTFIWKR